MTDPGLADSAADVALDGPEDRGGGKYRYERYRVTAGGQAVERDVVRVGPVVVVIPVDLNRGEVVMLRQFRLGAHLAIGRGEQVELPAGHVEAGEAAIEAARRECLEEIGVAPDVLVPLFGMLPSPGMSDEHQAFFLGVVDAAKVVDRAGAAHEHEDTRPFRVPIGRAIDALAQGGMQYGATVLGLQWLALNRARLAEIARGGGR
ncbi:MAG: NUDIX hydrolase [Xanthobacteraceae bacterium]|nr:NUDIX hydrolase [Xanthobacteraceae bacterium]